MGSQMAADDATGVMWCHRSQSWLTTGGDLDVEIGRKLPSLGVLRSHRTSRFLALLEVGKVIVNKLL